MLLAGSGPSLRAGRPLSDYEFSLRFPAANSRFASYADVAALGGAQAGSEWASSVNPASAAWPHPSRKYLYSFAPQFATVLFSAGTRLDVFFEALTLDAGAWGTFLPSAAQVRSNRSTNRQGSGFELEADYFQLQWGKLVTKHWAVGAMFGLSRADTRFRVDGREVGRSRGETYTYRAGVVHQAWETLRVGAVLEYASSPSRNRALAFDPATSTLTPVGSSDTTQELLLRTGLTWRCAKGCDLYVDYHGGVFKNDAGKLWVHRFPIGLEQTVVADILFARLGTTLDTRGNVAVTAGVGLSLGARASLDLAYQRDNFPEVRHEFGVSDSFVMSLGVGF